MHRTCRVVLKYHSEVSDKLVVILVCKKFAICAHRCCRRISVPLHFTSDSWTSQINSHKERVQDGVRRILSLIKLKKSIYLRTLGRWYITSPPLSQRHVDGSEHHRFAISTICYGAHHSTSWVLESKWWEMLVLVVKKKGGFGGTGTCSYGISLALVAPKSPRARSNPIRVF